MAGEGLICAPDISKFQGELEVLFDHERVAKTHPLVEALLNQRSGHYPSEVRDAADRILRAHAPWALDLEGSARTLVECAGDERSVRLFSGWALGRGRSMADLAQEEGISGQLASYRIQRAVLRVRGAVAATPPWSWLVESARRSLGRLTTTRAMDDVLVKLGVTTSPEAELLAWLAGPYQPVPQRMGWVAVEPRQMASRTAACLAADGGVRRLSDVQDELSDLDVAPDQFVAWLQANGSTVVHDLAVLVTGPLGDAVERLLDAHGTSRSIEEIAAELVAGGRAVDDAALDRGLRGRRFSRSGTRGRFGLTAWGVEKRSSTARPRRRPAKPVGSAPDKEGPASERRLWLWVKVDEEVLKGSDAPVPVSLIEGVGLAPLSRKTYSTRWGPVTLAHDGPQPTRGSVRAIALAAGANPDDTLLLGFSASSNTVAVEVRRGQGESSPTDMSGAALVLFPELEVESANGGTP